MVHMQLRPVHSSDGMRERYEGVERTFAAKSPAHVFRQVVDMDRTVCMHRGPLLVSMLCLL